MELAKHIKAYAAKNALDFGKADAGRILPKLFQHGLDKKDISKTMPEIQKIVSETNKLSKEELAKIVDQMQEYIKEREEKEKTLPELPNAVEGKVITRLAPAPSKYQHVGHGINFLINYIYSQRYKGKCRLRFEDANPEDIEQEFVDADLDEIENYLKIKLDSVRYVSDDIPLLYKHAETLIKKGHAYMCFCPQEKMQEDRHAGKECECRKQTVDENMSEWNAFIKGKYQEGKAVMRFKGDMKALNHVMRDPVLFRSVHATHFRQGTKYKVWPMYDFYNAIEDGLMQVTHILRSNEFEQRIPLQEKLREILELPTQTIVQYGRFNVIGSTTKGREIKEMIKAGKVTGWDDPRLVTLKAIRRRGIKAEVLYQLAEEAGLSKHEVNLSFDMIAAMSRKMIDADTPRYYFVQNPVPLTLTHTKESEKIKTVSVPIHPDKPQTRDITVGEVYISAEDKKVNAGKEVRLLHLFNIELPKRGPKAEVKDIENKQIPKIQWVSDYVKVKIMMPDATWTEGYAEKAVSKLKINDVVQFERFGFVKLDAVNKGVYEFWFTHK